MSNPLSVRRVKFQNLKEDGTADGPPTYGVIASDNFAKDFNNLYPSLEELNDAINTDESIIGLIDNWSAIWDEADPAKIGRGNYYGTDWKVDEKPTREV